MKALIGCLVVAMGVTALAASEVVVRPGESLAAAVERARASGVKTIRLRGGVHRIAETVRLTAADAGLAFVSAEGERAYLDGGVPLVGGAMSVDGLRVFPAPKIPFVPHGCGLDTPSHVMLARNGRLMREATFPAEGWCRIAEVTDETNGVFRAELPEAEGLVGAKGLIAHGFWKYGWADYAVPVDVSRDAHGLVFRLDLAATGKGRKYCRPRVGQPFRLMGPAVKPVSDWTWSYDRANGRILVRDAGSDAAYGILSFDGPFIAADGVDGLRFSGIGFRNGSGTGVKVSHAKGLVVENCTVENFGHCGIAAESVFGSVIRRSTFRGFGECGLKLVGGDRAKLASGGNVVEDCDFSDASRVVRSCTHIVVNGGVGNSYFHNWFHDTPASALRFDGNEHVFASNVVERCVTETDDWGAVENYGSPYYRGRIFHNVFRDIGNDLPWNDCGQCGVRFDDMVSGMVVYGNRFVNASRGHFGGVQVNGGKEVTVEHNLFVGGGAIFSVNSWTDDFWKKQVESLCERDKVDVTVPEWQARYGNLRDWLDAPRRHYVRHNVIVGGKAPVWLWGAGRCELVTERNQFLPANADLGGVGYDKLVGGADVHGILDGIDPLPPESALGIRGER